MDGVKDLLNIFFETEGPYGSKLDCEARDEVFRSWKFDPTRSSRSERKSRWPVSKAIEEEKILPTDKSCPTYASSDISSSHNATAHSVFGNSPSEFFFYILL